MPLRDPPRTLADQIARAQDRWDARAEYNEESMPYTPFNNIRGFSAAKWLIQSFGGTPTYATIGHNTLLTWPLDMVYAAIVHHETPIIIYEPNNVITLYCGGHLSASTQARFKAHLPEEWGVARQGGQYAVTAPTGWQGRWTRNPDATDWAEWTPIRILYINDNHRLQWKPR